jgi:hypothetical protein
LNHDGIGVAARPPSAAGLVDMQKFGDTQL